MRTTHTSVVGIPSKVAWATTVVRRFESGVLYGVLSFHGDEDAPHAGRKFAAVVSEDLELSSAQQVHQELKKLVSGVGSDQTLSAAFLWVEQTKLYVFCWGGGLVALQRKGKWRWLSESTKSEYTVQGTAQPQDVFVLLTARGESIRSFSQESLLDVESGASVFVPMVQRLDDQAELAVQLVQIGESPETTQHETTPLVSPARQVPRQPSLSTQADSNQPAFSPTHLISPAKLHRGVSDAQVYTPRRSRAAKWWSFLNWGHLMSLRSLNVLRVALGILVILAVVGGVVGMRSMRIKQEYETVVVPLIALTDEVQSFSADQRFAQRDAAKSLLERLQATTVSFQSNQREVQSLIAQVQPIYDQTAAEVNLINLSVFFDFRLAESNFLASRATNERSEAVFIDSAQSKALLLDLQSKRSQRVEAQQISGAKDIAMADGTLYWTTEQSLVQSQVSGSEITTLYDWPDGRDPAFIERYGENVYVLDRAAQQLWRFTGDEGASPSAWIRSARGVELSEATSLSIDGDIWIGTSQGDIYRLARGERLDFGISGLQQPLASSVLLATSTEGSTLAVVEPARQRIVFINKATGEYIRQVSSPQIGAVTDVFWDEGEQNLFLVAGSVVYRLEQ